MRTRCLKCCGEPYQRRRVSSSRWVLATLAAGLLIACATPHKKRHGDSSELNRRIDVQFDAADTNNDEWLSSAEFDAGLPWLKGKFDEVDTDHNGKVSLAELRSYIELQMMRSEPPHKKR